MTAVDKLQAGEDLLEAYVTSLCDAGMYVGKPVISVARVFFQRVGPDGWTAMSLDEQCELPGKYRRVVGWLMATGRLRATPAYLVRVPAFLGGISSRLHPDTFAAFQRCGAELGYDRKSIVQQWSAVAKTAALHCRAPDALSGDLLEQARQRILTALAAEPRDTRSVRAATSRDFFRAGSTLFHAGMLDRLPPRRASDKPSTREQQWERVAPGLRATMRSYIEQMRVSLRPSTVDYIDSTLREFGGFLADTAHQVGCVADIERTHLEAFKLHLAERPSAKGGRLSRNSIAQRLGTLGTFFERLTEWDGSDVPSRVLVFRGDLPIRDEPLPRFLDDAAAAKLLAAARSHPDPFSRLCVEFLARTGMRKGEFLALTVDAVVQIGSSFWLRVPLGKLHNDRYIPLHPQLKTLLDDWLEQRPPNLRTELMFTRRGRRIGKASVDKAVSDAARAAGIGHVTAHQLRHTLATQAINRGMSLEAIAALLGHRSMRMTMVYARIADRTVADEYFAVSEKVEALYGQPNELPQDAEGAEMRRLRNEMHRRMLGNGYCARPVELDCHFESICESCTFFVTTIEFKPTLRKQRDDAAAKGQVGRQKIFDGLLDRLDNQEAAS
jgi:integrase